MGNHARVRRGRPRVPGKITYVRLPPKVREAVDLEILKTRRPISTEIEILVEEGLEARKKSMKVMP